MSDRLRTSEFRERTHIHALPFPSDFFCWPTGVLVTEHDRNAYCSDSMQELLAVQQNRVLELESALSGTMREGLVRSSLISKFLG
jgi:hypothetical protein